MGFTFRKIRSIIRLWLGAIITSKEAGGAREANYTVVRVPYVHAGGIGLKTLYAIVNLKEVLVNENIGSW